MENKRDVQNRERASAAMPRATAFLRLHESGLSIATLARLHGLTRQRIAVLVAKARKAQGRAMV